VEFFQKPVKVEARQLREGTGPELEAWVNDSGLGYSATYWLGRLSFREGNTNVEWTIFPNEWLVLDDKGFKAYGVNEFAEKFEGKAS
jgi:hypothetical protein